LDVDLESDLRERLEMAAVAHHHLAQASVGDRDQGITATRSADISAIQPR